MMSYWDCRVLTCGNCPFNDGCAYTSLPPMYKCTFDNEFRLGNAVCPHKLQPVKQGQWVKVGTGYDGDEEYPIWKCSECGKEHLGHTPKFCCECGAMNGR